MLSSIESGFEFHIASGVPVEIEAQADEIDAAQEAEIRRRMYERIARGNALAEAEDAAQKMWRG
jgi:hypothetical protein